ncbi:hypothetical protein [Gandjariella thermophila]|uniref:Uncharacterized protein n=1 Tax=Gandjariella thermophila TaxID=1931992 RepID=A0A4D4JC03_9PSEU|nr:hypothetical protein [Gandjariella thermophila]GDY32872.1 hypothetical protein GTS_45050 [Gandjariella thermophila]
MRVSVKKAEIDGERLDDQQIVGFAAVLLLAGHITTMVLLGNAVEPARS